VRRPRRAGTAGRVSRSGPKPFLHHGVRLRRLGSALWRAAAGRIASLREIRGGPRHAVATPGDLLFHIRAERMDLCFELASQITARLGDTASVVDEVHCFRYFDIATVRVCRRNRELEAIEATVIGDEDPDFTGGSCVIIQRVSARYDGTERAAYRSAGAYHRPHQIVRYQARRSRLAELSSQCPDCDRGGQQGDQDRP
jgi:Dyp-type peroxidase family